MLIGRRGFLAGLGSLLAAPAIVHAGNLMPVRSIERFILPAFGYESFDHHVNLDVAYQWVTPDLFKPMTGTGWSAVPADRYSNQFQISGNTIEYGGCTLMQKPRQDMVNSRAREIQAAHDLVGNWKTRFAEFSPHVTQTTNTDYFHSVSDFGIRKP